MDRKGRVIINTGNGKGKTTAALGTGLRALGHGLRVCVIQFIKGQGDYGERLFGAGQDNLEWHICGKGFVFNRKNLENDKVIARTGFAKAQEKIASDKFDLIILDEITYLVHFGFIQAAEIVNLINGRPERLSIILTGRNAHRDLLELADTVTYMTALKHGFEQGITAQKGIEF